MRFKRAFTKFAKWTARVAGHPAASVGALAIVILWAATGPMFQFSETWQLVINTGTTIITFLMVFLIQNSQNRESAATHIKLDELIRAVKGAHNSLLDLEEMEEEDLERMRARYEVLARKAREDLHTSDDDPTADDSPHSEP